MSESKRVRTEKVRTIKGKAGQAVKVDVDAVKPAQSGKVEVAQEKPGQAVAAPPDAEPAVVEWPPPMFPAPLSLIHHAQETMEAVRSLLGGAEECLWATTDGSYAEGYKQSIDGAHIGAVMMAMSSARVFLESLDKPMLEVLRTLHDYEQRRYAINRAKTGAA